MTTTSLPRPHLAARGRTLVLGLGLAFGGAVLLAPGEAQAGNKKDQGSCTTVANVGSKVWKHTPGWVKNAVATSGPFGATAMQALKYLDEGIKIWNKIAGTGSAKIGARPMAFGDWNTGTLFGSTERMFVSNIPAVNPVEIDFHKLDHDGKVKVVVCKVPEKGKPTAIETFEVAAKAKKGKVKTIRINKAKGHVISVVLHGKSFSNKLEYKVRARMINSDDEDASTVTTVTGDRTQGTTYTGDRDGGDGGKKVTGKR